MSERGIGSPIAPGANPRGSPRPPRVQRAEPPAVRPPLGLLSCLPRVCRVVPSGVFRVSARAPVRSGVCVSRA
eukprot:5565460-Prymnesium_polylepis.1